MFWEDMDPLYISHYNFNLYVSYYSVPSGEYFPTLHQIQEQISWECSFLYVLATDDFQKGVSDNSTDQSLQNK